MLRKKEREAGGGVTYQTENSDSKARIWLMNKIAELYADE